MRSLIRAGLQMSFFSLPDTPDSQLFERTAAVAQAAEQAGFDSVFVMDHFWQLPFLGGPTQPMLEGYALLSALAARTSRVNLGTMVTGVTYRNPATLAKTITTLDVISQGRALCGLGAAWYEEEHLAFGYDYPSVPRRFEMLEDAIAICTQMFTRQAPTYSGTHFSIADAHNVPAPIRPGGPPLLIGGAGEKRTLRIAAEHAAASNFNCTVDEIPHKLRVLQGHLDAVGRSRDDINVTALASVVTAATDELAEAKLRRLLTSRGMNPVMLDDPAGRAAITSRIMVGGWDTLAEQLVGLCGLDGIDGIVAMLPADAGDPEGPAVAAEAFRRAALID